MELKADEKVLDKIENQIIRKAKASNEIRIGDLVEEGKEINLTGTTSPAALKLILERICALDYVALGCSTYRSAERNYKTIKVCYYRSQR